VQYRVTRTTRRHRIGNRHILAAIQNAGAPAVVETLHGFQPHYVGIDDRGVELHVVAVPDNRHEDGLAVIHAVPTSFDDQGGAS
jgi:predicted N-formylglutamate amidohydrolase